jgi:hypothetical protein
VFELLFIAISTRPADGPADDGADPGQKLWRYATPIDIVLRLCGFFAACGAGAALPLMTIVFGRLVNDFNDWGRGASAPDRLQAAVNSNAYVSERLFFLPEQRAQIILIQLVLCLSLHRKVHC